MRRRVGQPVARHHTVQATTAHPVMDVPMFLIGIDELDARSRRHQEVIGCLGDVTTMMEPIGIHVRREFFLDFARFRIATGVNARVFSRRQRCEPDQTVDDHQVLRRLIAAVGKARIPQLAAAFAVQADHFAVAAGVQHDVFVNDQARSKVERE